MMAKKFGGGSEAALLAGIVGHNLCIDRFGPPHSYFVKKVHWTKKMALTIGLLLHIFSCSN